MAVVCPSVCPVAERNSRMEGHKKLKIGKKEAHYMGDPWPHLDQTLAGAREAARLVCVTATLMSGIRLLDSVQ